MRDQRRDGVAHLSDADLLEVIEKVVAEYGHDDMDGITADDLIEASSAPGHPLHDYLHGVNVAQAVRAEQRRRARYVLNRAVSVRVPPAEPVGGDDPVSVQVMAVPVSVTDGESGFVPTAENAGGDDLVLRDDGRVRLLRLAARLIGPVVAKYEAILPPAAVKAFRKGLLEMDKAVAAAEKINA